MLGQHSYFSQARLRWVNGVLALVAGVVVLDHLLPFKTIELHVMSEQSYQERFSSRHSSWPNYSSTTTINANVLRLSDGTALQLTSLGDFIAPGDTLEIRRTPWLGTILEYRKKGSRFVRWSKTDGNELDYWIYPHLLLVCALLALVPWRGEYFRWSVQAAAVVLAVCWLVALIGTGGLGRLSELLRS